MIIVTGDGSKIGFSMKTELDHLAAQYNRALRLPFEKEHEEVSGSIPVATADHALHCITIQIANAKEENYATDTSFAMRLIYQSDLPMHPELYTQLKTGFSRLFESQNFGLQPPEYDNAFTLRISTEGENTADKFLKKILADERTRSLFLTAVTNPYDFGKQYAQPATSMSLF